MIQNVPLITDYFTRFPALDPYKTGLPANSDLFLNFVVENYQSLNIFTLLF